MKTIATIIQLTSLVLSVNSYNSCTRKVATSTKLFHAQDDRVPIRSNELYQRHLSQIMTGSALLIPVICGKPLIGNAAESVSELINESQIKATSDNKPSRKITSVAYIDVKIANYTEESVGKNRAASGSGRITFGLYGEDAPFSVKRFLETISSDGEKIPSYINTQFSRIVDNTLLQIESIPKLDVINIAGSQQYEYGGEILKDYTPILETNQIRHDRKGLLTRRQLSSGPEFGLTLKPSAELDGFNLVFGTVISGMEVLDAISRVQTYTYRTKTGYAGKEKGLGGDLADAWFENQKKFYVGVGKAFGDFRAVDRRGKLLRRVTIKGSGVLDMNKLPFKLDEIQ